MSARSGVIEMLPAPTAATSVPGSPVSRGWRSSRHQYGTPRGSSPGCAVNRSGGYEPARVTWVPAISLAGNDGKLMLRNVLTRAAMSWPSNAGRYPSTPPHSSGFPGPGATLSAAPLSAAGGSPRSAASRPAPQVPEYMMSPARLGPRLTPDSTRSGGRSSRALRPRATQSAGVPSTANSRSLSCRARNGWGREIELEAPDRSAAGATVHTSSLTESAAVLSFCSPIAPMPSSLTRRSRGPLTRLPYRRAFEQVGDLVVRPGDHVGRHHLVDRLGGGFSGGHRGPHRAHVPGHHDRDQAPADLLPADQPDVGRLDHGVSGFGRPDQPERFDHAQGLALDVSHDGSP